jgi:hypothetical protein
VRRWNGSRSRAYGDAACDEAELQTQYGRLDHLGHRRGSDHLDSQRRPRTSPAEKHQVKVEQIQESRQVHQQEHAEAVEEEAGEVETVIKQREAERAANAIEGR